MDERVKAALARHDDRVNRAAATAIEKAAQLSFELLRLEEGSAVTDAVLDAIEARAVSDAPPSQTPEAN